MMFDAHTLQQIAAAAKEAVADAVAVVEGKLAAAEAVIAGLEERIAELEGKDTPAAPAARRKTAASS